MLTMMRSAFVALAFLLAQPVSAQTVSYSLGKQPFLVVCQSAATGMSVTGTTAETALANCTIPAGAIGTSGRLRITTQWTFTGSTNTKTPRVRFHTASGVLGTVYMVNAVATAAQVAAKCTGHIWNRAVANSQIGNAICGDLTGTSSVSVTSAIDTAAATFVNLTGQLALGTETLTLDAYTVEIISPGS